MTIAIVDDHQLIIDGFTHAVKQVYPDSRVHTASDEQSLFTLLKREPIEILFLDIRLRRSDARDFMKKLRTHYPDLKIIIVSSLSDLPTIETLFKQGADGYLLKSDPKEEIIRAIKKMSNGRQKFMSKGIESRYFAHSIARSQRPTQLTLREKEILSLILSGKTTKEISELVFLSQKTIENHRANLFMKFEVKNVASLVKKAILEGHL